MNILQVKKKLRDLEASFIRDKRTGVLTNCYWNKMVAEDIDKLIKFIEDEEIARVDIETTVNEKAEKVIMDYLTDGNPEGDFTKSTIGADDKKAWYIKGYMDCLREMNYGKSYQSKLEFIIPVKDTVGKVFAENADVGMVIKKPPLPHIPEPPPARMWKEGDEPKKPKKM